MPSSREQVPVSSSPAAEPSATPASPFGDLAAYVALPRLGNLALSADGTRLAVAVQTLNP